MAWEQLPGQLSHTPARREAITATLYTYITAQERIVLALQYRFGPRNKQLMEFGVRPRAGGTRKKKETPPPAPTAPAEVQAVEAPVAPSPPEAP